MNENGLTFERWCDAAGQTPSAANRKRWEDGVDPCEMRAPPELTGLDPLAQLAALEKVLGRP